MQPPRGMKSFGLHVLPLAIATRRGRQKSRFGERHGREKLTLLALDDFGEGAVGYATNDGVSLLPVPTTVKPQMYVKALESIKAYRAGCFEEVEKPSE